MNRKEKANSRAANFSDSDLLTDEHDGIMLWLDTNVSRIFLEEGLGEVTEKRWEEPLLKGRDQYTTIVGYVDMMVHALVDDEYEDGEKCKTRKTYGLEVKSHIKNIGEVIRQINQYRVYTRNTSYFIVCPDASHASVFKSQGIGFIQSPQKKMFDNDYYGVEEDFLNGL